jgi:hypothetical protein
MTTNHTTHRHADGTEHTHEIPNLAETQHEHVPFSAVGPRRSTGTGPVVWSADMGLLFTADERAQMATEYGKDW